MTTSKKGMHTLPVTPFYAPVNVNPAPAPPPTGRDIAGHLRGIFRYLTRERTAGIGDFDDFCTLSKYSGEVDRGIPPGSTTVESCF